MSNISFYARLTPSVCTAKIDYYPKVFFFALDNKPRLLYARLTPGALLPFVFALFGFQGALRQLTVDSGQLTVMPSALYGAVLKRFPLSRA